MSADLESIGLDSLSNLTIASSPPGTVASLTDYKPAPYIDRLPVELLCRAFCWLPHFKDEDSGITLNARVPPWAPALHVCSSWRLMAMECKELWSWIPLGHPEWTGMALRLSDPVPIALCVPGDIFAPAEENLSLDAKLLGEAFTLALEHLPRVWHLYLTLHLESSDEDDGELYTRYVRVREMLAPLRGCRMDRLTSFTCVNADLRVGSFLEESWASRVQHLTLGHCRMSKTFQMCHLPLVSLHINMLRFEDTCAEFLKLMGSLQSLEELIVWDTLKLAYLNEIFDEASFSRELEACVSFPRLKKIFLSRSPLLMGFYLQCFEISRQALTTVAWFAIDYDVPDAIVPDYFYPKRWPLWDDHGGEDVSSGQSADWLGGVCLALLQHVHGIITNPQYPSCFEPTSFTHPKAYQSQHRYDLTMHAITWDPETSQLMGVWSIGTQPMYQNIFAVTSIVDYTNWESTFDIMRERGARSKRGDMYSTPAIFSCLFDDGSWGRFKEANIPPLTLIALNHVDFTNHFLEPYLHSVWSLLSRRDWEKGRIFDIHVLFPFGLKLSENQREMIMGHNLRASDFISDYKYPEFADNDP